MSSLFDRDRKISFGPSRLLPAGVEIDTTLVRGRSPSRLRQHVREEAPRVPGVYGWLDGHRRIVYVGKAKNLRARLLSYFRENSRDPKAGRIVANTRYLLWEPAASEFAALLRELELIRRYRPRFNVQGQPGRQRICFLCLGRSPAPYFYVERKLTGRELTHYGPLPSAGRAGDAARRLNDWFRLRDCSQRQRMIFSDQCELFPLVRTPGCLRHEIATCSGPCIAACSQQQYGDQARAARAFLDGHDSEPLTQLETQMTEAAGAFAFEQAAALRDRWLILRWLADHLGMLRRAREEHSFVNPLPGPDGLTWWYLIHRGRVWGVCHEPRKPAEVNVARRWLAAIYRPSNGGLAPTPADEVDSVLLVANWFRKHAQERQRLLTPTEALSRCQHLSTTKVVPTEPV